MTENEKANFLRKLRIGKPLGGHLELWGVHYFQKNRYSGIITNDPTDRFEDGEVVTTALCIKMHNIDNVKILETIHSYYTLGCEGTYVDREDYKESEEYDNE